MNELDQMVRTDKEGHPILLAARDGLQPIYFTEETRRDPDPFFDEIIEMSRQLWTYLGYTGFMTPWHDEDPYKFLRMNREKFRKFFYRMEEIDVHWKSYCVLSFLMTPYEYWERPALLLIQVKHWAWIKKLRLHVGSREGVDRVAFFMLEFIKLQIRHHKRAYFSQGVFLAADPKALMQATQRKKSRKSRETSEEKKESVPKYLVLYTRIADRIEVLRKQGVDYLEWLRIKFANCVEIDPDTHVKVNAVVNVNSLDPDTKAVVRRQEDPWRYIREFLGLSPECVFRDKSIPKGWRPSSDDEGDLKKISHIQSDGYYYYADGTQRRGKRHYANNKYLCIMCTPQNFVDFKPTWDDPRLFSGSPTWDEYSNWGLYPGVWDKHGTNISDYRGIRNVRWRGRGR